MTQRTVTIYSNCSADPRSLSTRPGDQVTFKAYDSSVNVTIKFVSSSPFQDTTFELDGSNQALASPTKEVLSNAGSYPYQVSPANDTSAPVHTPGMRPWLTGEPNGSTGGDIDVSGDPGHTPDP